MRLPLYLLLALCFAAANDATERAEIERWQREARAREDAEELVTISDAEMAEAEEFLKEDAPPRQSAAVVDKRLLLGTICLGVVGIAVFASSKPAQTKSRSSAGMPRTTPRSQALTKGCLLSLSRASMRQVA